MKIRIAKFQGPINPPRYQEPPQIVQDIPPTHIPKAPNSLLPPSDAERWNGCPHSGCAGM